MRFFLQKNRKNAPPNEKILTFVCLIVANWGLLEPCWRQATMRAEFDKKTQVIENKLIIN